MDHPAAVSIFDRIAHVDETPEQLLEPQRGLARTKAAALVKLLDRVFETLALDESHHVERLTPGVQADPVDGNNSGVLQPRRHLGFHKESRPAVRFLEMLLQQLFEGDLAVQLHIEGDRDLADSPLGVGANHEVALVLVSFLAIRPVDR